MKKTAGSSLPNSLYLFIEVKIKIIEKKQNNLIELFSEYFLYSSKKK